MDLSEMTRLEKSTTPGVKPGEVLNVNTTKMTAQEMNRLMDELSKAVSDAMLLGSFAAPKMMNKPLSALKVNKPCFQPEWIQEYSQPLLPVTRAAERELLLKLADALEVETDAMHCEQVYGNEHTHSVSLGHYYAPRMPSITDVMVGPASEAATIKMDHHERVVHYVCALGKIGVVLARGNPRGWRSLDLPPVVRNLIVQLNDGHKLSFTQIAAALRSRAAGLA